MASDSVASVRAGTSQAEPNASASTPTSTMPLTCESVTKTPRITASIGPAARAHDVGGGDGLAVPGSRGVYRTRPKARG